MKFIKSFIAALLAANLAYSHPNHPEFTGYDADRFWVSSEEDQETTSFLFGVKQFHIYSSKYANWDTPTSYPWTRYSEHTEAHYTSQSQQQQTGLTKKVEDYLVQYTAQGTTVGWKYTTTYPLVGSPQTTAVQLNQSQIATLITYMLSWDEFGYHQYNNPLGGTTTTDRFMTFDFAPVEGLPSNHTLTVKFWSDSPNANTLIDTFNVSTNPGSKVRKSYPQTLISVMRGSLRVTTQGF